MNNIAMNSYLEVFYKFLCGRMFSSFLGIYLGLERIPAGLYAKSVFNFLRTGQTVFSGSCPVSYVLTSNAPKGPNFHILSGLSLFVFFFFFLLPVPVGVRCISLGL